MLALRDRDREYQSRHPTRSSFEAPLAPMHIPASRLISLLAPGLSFEVRTADYSGFDRAMPYTEALARAIRGEVEGVTTPAGKLKYLRILPEPERQPAPESLDALDRTESKGGRIGAPPTVFREAVESSEMDPWGMPTRIIIGHIWQHCGARV